MFKPDLLKGAHILITGGGTGLGKSMGRRFMELGARLTLCGRRLDVLEATAAEHRAATGSAVTAVACDIRDPDAVEALMAAAEAEEPVTALVKQCRRQFPGPQRDALAARGRCGGRHRAQGVVERDPGARPPMACREQARDGAQHRDELRVDRLGLRPAVGGGQGRCACDDALARSGMGRARHPAQRDCPGPFPTEGAWERLVPRPELARAFESRNPLGRPGDHRELADLASFLLADGSGYVNGEVVTIDGGEWLRGAGQFSFLMDMLDESDWESLRPARR